MRRMRKKMRRMRKSDKGVKGVLKLSLYIFLSSFIYIPSSGVKG